MYKDNGKDDSDGIITLVRETADGFGHLIADHIRLARLELVADVKRFGGQVALIVAVGPIIFLGYALACVGLAVVLTPSLGQAGAFFLIGGVNVVVGAIAIRIALNRLSRAKPLHDTAIEVDRSVTALTSPRVVNGAAAAAERRG